MTTDDTGAALNRKLAEARGWCYEFVREDREYESGRVWIYFTSHDEKPRAVLMISGHLEPSSDYVWKRLIAENRLPDWANDVGAALALCLDVARERGYELTVIPTLYPNGEVWKMRVAFRTFDLNGIATWHQEVHNELATALARLALAALT